MKRKLWSFFLSAMLAVVTVFAFAACSPVTYSITFKNYDGAEITTLSVVENGEVSYNGETPSREATAEFTYTFAGWADEAGTVLSELPAAKANATYTATYTSAKNSYTVTIMNGTTELDKQTLEYGATVEYTGKEPTKDATAQYTYTFAGWATEEDGEVTGFATVTGNATYYAVYTSTVNEYAITWNVEGVTTSETLAYGATPAYDGTPAKDATAQYTYTFAGWSTTEGGEVAEVATVTGAQTYYAIFTATTNEYAITWNVNGTTTSADFAYGVVPTYSGTPAKDSTAQYAYTFAGWATTADGEVAEVTAVTGEATYYAIFTATTNKYAITWNVNGTTTSADFAYGVVPTYSGTPAKDATAQYTYAFAGWSTTENGEVAEIAAVTGAQTYYAIFTATTNKYAITWNVNGTTTSETLAYGATPVYSGTPAKDATAQYTYTFAGWSTTENGEVAEVTAVTGAQTYYAIFTATTNKYAITWNVNGTQTTAQVEYGATPAYDGTPAKDATAQYTYTFAGWSTTENGEVAEVATVTGAQTYYAIFTATTNKYAITWNVNGTTTSETLEYGATPAYDGTPAKDATAQYTYTFAGWSTTENGEVGAVATVTGEATYYAIFTATTNKYAITWNIEGATTSETLEYGATPAYSGTPAKDATAQYTYTFAGWATTENGEVAEVATVTGEATYYAIFTATTNKYAITWNVNGTETSAQVEYGVVPAFEGTPEKEATAKYTYTFAGWATTENGEVAEIAAVTGEATYYAIFTSTVNEYKITWNMNGLTKEVSVAYDEVPVYSGMTPAKGDTMQYAYTFAGWATTADGEVAEIPAVTGDATYYAVYTAEVKEYTVSFYDENGETLLQAVSFKYGETPKFPADVNAPAKDETEGYTYTYAGWKNSAIEYKTDELPAVTGDASYDVVFTQTAKQYTITVNYVVAGEGEKPANPSTQSVTLDYGTIYNEDNSPVSPEVEGYLPNYYYFGGIVTKNETYTVTYGKASVWDGTYPTVEGYTLAGTGTAEDPYLIQSAQDLAYLSAASNGVAEYGKGLYYKVTTNIDLAGYTWNPIGKEAATTTTDFVFAGTFDGAGHTIGGLYHNSDKNLLIALFNSTAGTIKNVIVEGSVKGAHKVAGLVALAKANTVIENCISYVDVSYTTEATWDSKNNKEVGANVNCGGIAGAIYSTTIKNSINYGDITGKGSRTAGFGGVCQSSSLSGCINYGDVTGRSHNIGGLLGIYDKGTLKVTGCANYGQITSTNDFNNATSTAGLVAQYCIASTIEISDSYNYGDVSGFNYVGGAVGNIPAKDGMIVKLTNFYNYGKISGNNNIGGAIGIQNTNTKAGFNTSTTIQNVYNYGDVVGTDLKIAGIVGYAACAKLENVYNYGDIYGKNVNVAGILGWQSGDDVTIDKAYNYGNIFGHLPGETYATAHDMGGIVGYGSGAVTNSVNYGYIKGVYYLGGIMGDAGKGASFENCINYGDVEVVVKTIGASSKGVAGICGWQTNATHAVNCKNYGDVYGYTNVGGISGYLGGGATCCTVVNGVNYGTISGHTATGGIAGHTNGDVFKSENYGTVIGLGTATNIGGICGYSERVIEDSKNYGDVYGLVAVGGIAGRSNGEATAVTSGYNVWIINSENNGNVYGVDKFGGIVGDTCVSKVTNCTNNGAVASNGELVEAVYATAGIVGHATNNTVITDCTNNGTVTGDNVVGGIAGYLGAAGETLPCSQIIDCVNNGKVNGWTESSTGELAGNNRGEIIFTEDETPEVPIV